MTLYDLTSDDSRYEVRAVECLGTYDDEYAAEERVAIATESPDPGLERVQIVDLTTGKAKTVWARESPAF